MKKRSHPSVIIYDGDCRLCNRAVRFLKSKKTPEGFLFIPSSGAESAETLAKHGLGHSVTKKTVILIEENKIYKKSAAIIRALQLKGRIWKLAGIFFVIPKFLRDFIYDRISATRTK